jgi:hypothetical protein
MSVIDIVLRHRNKEKTLVFSCGMDGRKILKWNLNKWDGWSRIGLIWLRLGRRYRLL